MEEDELGAWPAINAPVHSSPVTTITAQHSTAEYSYSIIATT
jgi:hypothetical protein